MNWTTRDVLAAGFAVLFLGVQLTVPIVQLTGDRPARYAWHMFSGAVRPRVTLVFPDSTTRVDLTRYVTHLRGDTRITEHLPPHLCRLTPDAVAVRIATAGAASRTVPCR